MWHALCSLRVSAEKQEKGVGLFYNQMHQIQSAWSTLLLLVGSNLNLHCWGTLVDG